MTRNISRRDIAVNDKYRWDSMDAPPAPRDAVLVDYGKQIGANLKRLRQGLGLTQMEFCDRTGLAQSQISALENGRIPAALDRLLVAVERVGLDPWDLFLPPDTDGHAEEIQQLLRSADEDVVGAVLVMLRSHVSQKTGSRSAG